jgi:putative transposase
MEALEAEAIHLLACDSFEDGAADIPRFVDEVYNVRQPNAAVSELNPIIRGGPRAADGRSSSLNLCRP